MKHRQNWFDFHQELMGFKIKNKKGFNVPKYVAYWNGYTSNEIISGRKDLRLG